MYWPIPISKKQELKAYYNIYIYSVLYKFYKICKPNDHLMSCDVWYLRGLTNQPIFDDSQSMGGPNETEAIV